jgi:hypothetical protein
MNHDAGDVRGLEEVFRSQEISRTIGGIGGDAGTNSARERDGALLRRMFGHAPGDRPDLHRDGEGGATDERSHSVAPATALDAGLMADRHPDPASAGGGAAQGTNAAARSAEPRWKRQSGRYWTVAALSAVIALVVAGVTAGTAQHGPSSKSAQGAHGTVQPHGGVGTPGAASTAPTAPGSLTGAIGSGALALGAHSAGARGPGNQPGGRVTLTGAATTTGTLPSSGGSPGSAPPGGGSSGAPPGSGGTNPVTPVAAGVGNTVSTVGTSVTGLANQLGSTVPAAAPATSAVTSAVSGVLDSVDQAVGATAL